MGYYSHFFYYLNNAVADTKKVKELEEFFEEDRPDNIYGFARVKIRLENPNDIESEVLGIYVNESFTNFYDDDLFAEKLSKVLIVGSVILKFCGEDGHVWGYEVKRNKVQRLSMQWVESKVE
jgi:hypothetical protein